MPRYDEDAAKPAENSAFRTVIPDPEDQADRFQRSASQHQIMASIPLGQWRQQRKVLQMTEAQAMERWRQAVTENAIQPFFRLWANSMITARFDRNFSIFDATGLHQARARRYLMETNATKQLKRIMIQLDGGAVGIIGPRGAGKTTILETLTSETTIIEPHTGTGQPSAGAGRLLLVENAPLEYQPREFALHLYARLCQQIIQLVQSTSPARNGIIGLRIHRFNVLFLLLILAAGISTTWLLDTGSHVISADLLQLALIIGTLSIAAVALTVTLNRVRRPQPVTIDEDRPVSLASLRRQAERRLMQVRYLQRHTVGWSGTLSAGGAQAASSHNVEFAQQTMTHPEVVHAFRDFLRSTVEILATEYGSLPAPVIIAIDELDRLPPESSASFISEIKALLSPPLPGCLYLMAVSDEAMFSLDTAGNVSQDFFYSAFDAMIHVGHLELEDAARLLRARAIGLPDPFLWLCHCLSGGLPRELIRIARAVTEIGEEITSHPEHDRDVLTPVSQRVVGDELAHNINIVRVASGMAGESLRDSMADLLKFSRFSPPKFDDLLALIDVVAAIPGRDSPQMATVIASQTSRMAALGQLYQYATVLQAFDAGSMRLDGSDLLRSAHEDAEIRRRLNILAAARPLLSVEPGLGWTLVSSFRAQWEMKTYDFPLLRAI